MKGAATVDQIEGTALRAGFVRVVLEGGPTALSGTERTVQVSDAVQKIKVQHEGGYEIFERVADPSIMDTSQTVVFRWSMRTKIAE
jgi:hypothetical protein